MTFIVGPSFVDLLQILQTSPWNYVQEKMKMINTHSLDHRWYVAWDEWYFFIAIVFLLLSATSRILFLQTIAVFPGLPQWLYSFLLRSYFGAIRLFPLHDPRPPSWKTWNLAVLIREFKDVAICFAKRAAPLAMLSSSFHRSTRLSSFSSQEVSGAVFVCSFGTLP